MPDTKLLRDAESFHPPLRESPSWPAAARPRVENPDLEHVRTSCAERQHLTMRVQMRRLTRLTNALSEKFVNHLEHVRTSYQAPLQRNRAIVDALASTVLEETVTHNPFGTGRKRPARHSDEWMWVFLSLVAALVVIGLVMLGGPAKQSDSTAGPKIVDVPRSLATTGAAPDREAAGLSSASQRETIGGP